MTRRRMPLVVLLAVLAVAALIYFIFFADTSGTSGRVAYDVRINEVMTSNKGSVVSPTGTYPDWVELQNTSAERVNLAGYGLTDDKLSPAKWAFPTGTYIEPYGHLVVWCSGDASEGSLFAGFKLAATDDLVLLDPSGRPVDSLALTSVPSGYSLGRDVVTGMWGALAEVSPGYPNTPEGAQAYRDSLHNGGVDVGVVINEFMPANASTVTDENGLFSDWVELYNTTDTAVDLSGFGLSDDLKRPMRWAFPSGTTIPAKGYFVVFLSGAGSAELSEELHASFSLRAYKEDVVFTSPRGNIVDSHSYANAESDVAFARSPDGTGDFVQTSEPTPGYPNSAEGYRAFEAAIRTAAAGPVVISEMLTANDSYVKADDGEYYDWIELYNRSDQTVDLAGYALTNRAKNPAKWVFPQEASIQPGEYLVVLASGNDVKDTKKKYLETNFKLSSAAGAVLLYDPPGNLLDKLTSASHRYNVSVGRDLSGAQRLFYETPTPGAANGTGAYGISSTPQLLTTPGIFDAPVAVELAAGAGQTIYYTTDSTPPTTASSRYTGPIKVSENTVIRAVAHSEGYLAGDSVSGTYLFRSDGAHHQLPVATLVMDPDDLWDSKTGIYATGDNFDPDQPDYGDVLLSATYYQSKQGNKDFWEREASFAIFNEEGVQVFSQNIGARIGGSYGRGRAQKAFNLMARDEYGNNRMDYPFFEQREFTQYKALVLRAGAQDQNRSKIRDELATGLLEGTDMNLLFQAYKPYVLYLNDEYWGVYFLKEKRNRFFVAQHEGTEDAVNLDIGKGSEMLSYGSNADWLSLMAYVRSHDLSNAAHYEYVAARMDTASFMDYMIAQIYTGNTDTYNIQYYKYRDGGKWKWIFYDFCWGFNSAGHASVAYRRGSVPAGSDLFNALLNNPGWRDAFLRRFGELLATAFAPERVLALIDQLYAAVEPEIAREREKFNQGTFMGVRQPQQNLGTYDGFVRQIESLKTFARERPAALTAQLKSEFSLTDSYVKEVFG